MDAPKILKQPDLGLLIIRVMIGVVGFYHGAQKVFGAFGGSGMGGFTKTVAGLHMPLPTAAAWAAAFSELVGGVLMALGVAPRIAAAFFAFTMATAFLAVHHGTFDKAHGGNDSPLALAMVAIGLIFTGAGRFSLMRLFKGRAAGQS